MSQTAVHGTGRLGKPRDSQPESGRRFTSQTGRHHDGDASQQDQLALDPAPSDKSAVQIVLHTSAMTAGVPFGVGGGICIGEMSIPTYHATPWINGGVQATDTVVCSGTVRTLEIDADLQAEMPNNGPWITVASNQSTHIPVGSKAKYTVNVSIACQSPNPHISTRWRGLGVLLDPYATVTINNPSSSVVLPCTHYF